MTIKLIPGDLERTGSGIYICMCANGLREFSLRYRHHSRVTAMLPHTYIQISRVVQSFPYRVTGCLNLLGPT